MSTLSRTKYLAVALAAASCLAFASGVGAAGMNDDENAFPEPFSALCHPAYQPCQKWPNAADRVAKASATPAILIAQASADPASDLCHPARQSCATRANPRSSVSK
jgi:hypothetical protein